MIKCVFLRYEKLLFLSSICQKCHGTQIKCLWLKGDEKGRGTAITKLLQIGLKWCFFRIWCIKAMFLVCLKHTFYVFWPLPFLRVFKEIRSLSPLKCAKRKEGTKKCVVLQETFVLSSICQKCQVSE